MPIGVVSINPNLAVTRPVKVALKMSGEQISVSPGGLFLFVLILVSIEICPTDQADGVRMRAVRSCPEEGV